MTIGPMTAPLVEDEHGIIRVGGTRVPLERIICAFRDGCGPEEIASQYTAVSLEAVYGAITYYLGHREEVDAYVERQRVAEEEALAKIPERPDMAEFRERLLARAKARGLR